jgi:tetratricopeptide (TPR) repeat protein
MNRVSFLSALLTLTFVLLLNLPAFAAETELTQNASLEQSLARAAGLMRQGKAQEAGEIYAALMARYPNNGELALARARAAMAANDTATALPIYDRLMADNPGNTELRLEAARAYYAAGNEREAMRLGRQVLQDYQKQRFQLQGSIRTGVVYDSNANHGPASDMIRLGDWDLTLTDGKAKSTFGAHMGANLDMGYRLSAISPWWLVGDINGFWRVNTNSDLRDINRNQLLWGRAAMGLRYLDGICASRRKLSTITSTPT